MMSTNYSSDCEKHKRGGLQSKPAWAKNEDFISKVTRDIERAITMSLPRALDYNQEA
jgi:hypothetical protein